MTTRRLIRLSMWAIAVAVVGGSGGSHGQSPAAHTVDQKEACVSCHDLEGAFDGPVRHAPVEAAECSACHNPHAARLSFLLRGEPAKLCASCHAEIERARGREHVHPPVEEGECSTCHQPHASEHPGLLIASRKELCLSCHEGIETWRSRKFQHSPFRRGQCVRCHDPHAGDFPALGAASEAELCGSCHPASAKFRADHGGFPVQDASCHQCHDPHASDGAGLFRAHLHAPFDSGDCTTCHAGANSAVPFELVAGQAQLCGECHEEQVAASRTAPFPHVSAGGGNCTACHNPHAGESRSLLHGSEMSACLTCHDPGGSKSGLEGRFTTHADLGCAECHDPHGGERPQLLVADAVQMCNECHGHQHNVSHPMGAEHLDPRSGRPLDCLSCHGIHESPAEMYLHAAARGELCIGCHKEIRY